MAGENLLRPVFDGPALQAAADGTDATTIVAINGAKGFYCFGSAAYRIKVNSSAAAIGAGMATQGTLFAPGVVYGPFAFGGPESHIHIAGAGGASSVTITLV